MGRPQATRRKVIVSSSDDEAVNPHSHHDIPPSPQPTQSRRLRPRVPAKTGTTAAEGSKSGPRRSAKASPDALSSPPPSSSSRRPTGPSQPAKTRPQPKLKEKPIFSFFNAATQRQQAQPATSTAAKRAPPAEDVEEDFIEDDSLDDEDMLQASQAKNASVTAFPSRKRVRDKFDTGPGDADGLLGASQKFLKTAQGARLPARPTDSHGDKTEDQRPWTEQFAPVSLDELAVHKRKVADVRGWLDEVFSGRSRQRALILKGAAGSGKTTTVNLLSRAMGFHLKEWRNPTDVGYTSEGFVSLTAQFEDFLGRTGKFGSLEFVEAARSQDEFKESNTSSSVRQAILVEEFPVTVVRSSAALSSFRSTLLQFLAANMPSLNHAFASGKGSVPPATPLIIVISETLLSTNTASMDSFTAHKLLGHEILNHPGVAVIEFNPIAPTFLSKALELVVAKESKSSGRRTAPGPQVIKRLAEIGDVRSAVSSLEFMCLRGDKDGGWGGKVLPTKSKITGSKQLTKTEQESLELVTQRESALGIFHAVGKVVYNKRADPPPETVVPQPPEDYPHHQRPAVSEVDVDSLLDELGTDIQVYVAALHENYILSCCAASTEATLDSVNGCIDALSEADLLSSDRFDSSRRRVFQGSSIDTLRQDEMCFHVGTRGLLFNLPHPVKRIAPPTVVSHGKTRPGGKQDAHKMYYPTSLKLWRQREEVEGTIDLWVSRAQTGQLPGPLTARTQRTDQRTDGVDSWRRSAGPDDNGGAAMPLLTGGHSARREMLLERLPYMSLIHRGTLARTAPQVLHELETVTQFGGIGGLSNDLPDDDDDDDDDAAVAGGGAGRVALPHNPAAVRFKPVHGTQALGGEQQQQQQAAFGGALPELAEVADVAKLVLSDDDIED